MIQNRKNIEYKNLAIDKWQNLSDIFFVKRSKYIILFFSFFILTQNASAQKFIYNTDFVSYFDNREYHSRLQHSQTIFGIRFSPEIGIELNNSDIESHKMMAGITYLQPFGNDWKSIKLFPRIYYQMDLKKFTINLGFVPYTNLKRPLPDFLMSDSLSFAYPNIQGGLFQYQTEHGYAEAICDWRGMRDSDTREAFRIILNGMFKYKYLFAGAYAQMNHLAKNANEIPLLSVCDDVYINPFLGIDLSNKKIIDSLSLQFGYVIGYQRERNSNSKYIPQGFRAELFLNWKFIGIRNRLHIGENMMPLFRQYKTLLNQGEQFYMAEVYDRLDFFVYFVKREFVICYFSWNFHFIKNENVSHQQQLVLKFNLNSLHKTNN